MTGFDQGFTKPNRNAASWDSDLNANFTLIERGHVIPLKVGSSFVNTGQLLEVLSNAATEVVAQIYVGGTAERPAMFMALQAGSPGNTIYGLQYGAVNSWSAYSGQLRKGSPYYTSVVTPGWVTSSLDEAILPYLGRQMTDGSCTFFPTARNPTTTTKTVSGIAHCASGSIGAFSFSLVGFGAHGTNTLVRVRSNSCNNYRVTFFANSARNSIIYDTVVNSGNIGVTTNDMIDAATWPYSLGFGVYPLWGIVHGVIEVLSSAFTSINSQAFQVNFSAFRNI